MNLLVCRWSENKIQVMVGVAFFVLASAGLESAASASASWSKQSSWSDSTPNPIPSRKSISREAAVNKDLSPFSPGSNNVALDIGQVFLMGDLGGKYGDSIGSQLHYTYGVSDMFGFDASAGYSNHSDGRFSMGSLLTGLRTNLSWYDKVVPYAVFGLGFYKPSYEIAPGSSISPMVFGIHMGPGIDLELTRQLFFGAGLTFHNLFGSTRVLDNGKRLDIGGTYTSFLLHAGFTF